MLISNFLFRAVDIEVHLLRTGLFVLETIVSGSDYSFIYYPVLFIVSIHNSLLTLVFARRKLLLSLREGHGSSVSNAICYNTSNLLSGCTFLCISFFLYLSQGYRNTA